MIAHEPDAISRKTVRLGGLGFLAFAIVSTWIGLRVLHAFAASEPLGGPEPAHAPQVGIVEQTLIERTNRGRDLADAQRRSLETWGWVDRDHGVARIPIDRAMDVVADGGAL